MALTGLETKMLAALKGLVERGTDSPEHMAAEDAIADAEAIREAAEEATSLQEERLSRMREALQEAEKWLASAPVQYQLLKTLDQVRKALEE